MNGPTVIWAGEILGLGEMRRALGLTPDASDAAVLLEGWRRWGYELLPRLEGTFALALEDGDDVILFRDPSGLQSLYFAIQEDATVCHAGRLEPIQARTSRGSELDRRSLHEYLRFLEVAPPRTVFTQISAVEAGHAVQLSNGRMASSRPLTCPLPSNQPPNFDAAVDHLDTHLQRSVRTRLIDAARPAAFLSGGIDSALLCAIAGRQRPDLRAVTVGFEGASYDETPVAGRIAAHLGLEHEVLRFSREQYLAAFDRLSRYAEQPMSDPAAMATLLAFDHCREHYDVVLDGTGADEAVGMMPPRHVRLAVGYASRLPGFLRQQANRLLRAIPALAGMAPLVDFDHPADTMSRWHGFTREEVERLCEEPVSFAQTQFFRTFNRYPRHAHFERYSALLNAMTCDRLNQAMLLTGATVRFPFWDRQTDRFIRQLRTDYRYLPGQPKRILRALLARYMPAAIWDLPKHGFNFPLSEFLSGDDFLLLRRHLAPERWHARGLLSVEQVQRYGRDFMAGDQRLAFRVWGLVVLGAWLEHHEGLPGQRA